MFSEAITPTLVALALTTASINGTGTQNNVDVVQKVEEATYKEPAKYAMRIAITAMYANYNYSDSSFEKVETLNLDSEDMGIYYETVSTSRLGFEINSYRYKHNIKTYLYSFNTKIGRIQPYKA